MACVIDGESLLFHASLIGRGREGGREAGTRLLESLLRYVVSNNMNSGMSNSNQSSLPSPSATPKQNITCVSIYIFFNKEELVYTILNNRSAWLEFPEILDPLDIREYVDEFVRGINDADGKDNKILMVDVGGDEGVTRKAGSESMCLVIKLAILTGEYYRLNSVSG